MEGPEGAAQRVAGWLTARLPTRLRAIEARLTLPAGTLPDPGLVTDHESGPIALEEWPAVIVLPQELRGLAVVEAGTEETYAATYAVRVVAWVRADDYAATDALRKRYLLAVREALLERKSLRAAPAYGTVDQGVGVAVDPASLREAYSPPMTDDAARTIAGGYIDVNVTVLEGLDAPDPLADVDIVELHPQPLAPPPGHPGLM